MSPVPRERRYCARSESNIRVSLSFMGTVEESMSRRQDLAGSIVDVNEGGVGLLTGFPVEQGQILRFKVVRPAHGMVVWSSKVPGRCRSGVKFIRPADIPAPHSAPPPDES
ncbi:MAG: PilZ domain-containing protein [Chloroflexota bacterium]